MKGILLDPDTGDLTVTNGSLTLGQVDEQCARLLVPAFTGEFKNAPMLGGNAARLIGGAPDAFWRGQIKQQLRSCLVDVESVDVVDGAIELNIR